MGFFKKKEKRAIKAEDPALVALIGNDEDITEKEAMQVPMVAACVEWICGTVARLPVRLYKKDGDTVKEVESDRRTRILNQDTGDLLDAYQMKKAWCRDYLMAGAGYLYIEKQRNSIDGLYYVDEKNISVTKNCDPIYKTAEFLVGGRTYREFEFVRITRNTKDGVNGVGILEESPLILSVAYQTFKYQYQLVRAGGCRKGFLLSEKPISTEVMDALKKAWRTLFKSGEENVIVLNNGLKFQEASNTSVEMQLNENKKSDSESVCNLFGLSPTLFSGNISDEQYNNSIKTAVLPILDAMTEAYNKSLLLESEKGSMYFEIDTRNLLKGDLEKRFSAYKLAAESNIMQLDEIRQRENLPALGMNFIKLGLQDVLYNPKTGEIFTPNTGVTANIKNGMSKESLSEEREDDILEERGKYIQGPDGKMQGSMPDAGWSAGKRKTKYAPSPRRNHKGINVGAKKYAKLCGELGTQHPNLKKGQSVTIRDAKYSYRVTADGYGGMTINSKYRIGSGRKKGR